MKVAVVHNLPRGGAWRRLSEQLRHFRADFVELCLTSAEPITDNAIRVPVARHAPSLPRAIRPAIRYTDLLLLEAAWRRAAHEVRLSGSDVVYLNPCQFLQAPPILARVRTPAVYFCDEARRVDAEEPGESSRNRLTKPLYKPIYARERHLDRSTTARAELLATNSRYSAAEIERVYGRHATVVRLGVASNLLGELEPTATEGFVLSVGTLIPGKGHDLVVRAAAACAARQSVRIVAPRPGHSEEARLRSLARELGVAIDVQVGITDEALAALYGSALATVYMAATEPFGLVSIEAQARGCPVIVAAEGGLPETILEGETGWSCPRDPAAVARRIDELTDPATRDRISQAARTHGLTWTWEASAAHVEELLTSVRGTDTS